MIEARPRVAMVSSHFLPYSQTFVYDEVRHHTRYDVEVFAARRVNAALFPFAPVHVGGPLFEVTRLSPRLRRRVRRGGFSLVHAHFGTGALYGTRLADAARLPLVVTFHGHDVSLLQSGERLLPRNWPYALLAPAMLRRLTLGLCASVELLELVHEAGVPRERLRLHHIGVDTTRFQPSDKTPDAPVIAMVGRFVRKKGLPYGVRAFAKVARRHARARLEIVGDGPLRAEIEAERERSGVADRIALHGVLPQARVAELLGRASVLLAPSVTTADGDRESGLMVAKEASLSGAVPIGTWHGGLPEIIDDGVTGRLVAERDVEALAAALDEVLSDEPRRASMARAAQESVRLRFDVRVRGQALERAYDDAIARGGRHGRRRS